MRQGGTHLIPDRLPDFLHGGAVEGLPRGRAQLLEERLEEADQAVLVGVAVHHDVEDSAGHDLQSYEISWKAILVVALRVEITIGWLH